MELQLFSWDLLHCSLRRFQRIKNCAHMSSTMWDTHFLLLRLLVQSLIWWRWLSCSNAHHFVSWPLNSHLQPIDFCSFMAQHSSCGMFWYSKGRLSNQFCRFVTINSIMEGFVWRSIICCLRWAKNVFLYLVHLEEQHCKRWSLVSLCWLQNVHLSKTVLSKNWVFCSW